MHSEATSRPEAGSRVREAFLVLLALALPIGGFMVGYGFQTRRLAELPQPTPQAARPPLVKALLASPDDKFVAWTMVWNQGNQAGRCLLRLPDTRFTFTPSPGGWQDFITQWTPDSRKLVFEREALPRSPQGETRAGIYQSTIEGAGQEGTGQPEELTRGGLPAGEKVISGQVLPGGELLIKSRRDARALYHGRGNHLTLLDRSPSVYLQNRVIRQNGHLVTYVVRPRKVGDEPVLLRVTAQGSKVLSPPLGDLTWAYVEEQAARWMITCQDLDGESWVWTSYTISPSGCRQVAQATIPGDVVSVFASPDGTRILGSGGEYLWLVSVPDLKCSRLGETRWEAEDATWLHHQPAVIVASRGGLWKVEIPSGKSRNLLTIPKKFWN